MRSYGYFKPWCNRDDRSQQHAGQKRQSRHNRLSLLFLPVSTDVFRTTAGPLLQRQSLDVRILILQQCTSDALHLQTRGDAQSKTCRA